MDPLTLTITWNGTQCHVHGPVNQKMLCYAILEMARDAIYEHHLKLQQKSRIVVPDLELRNGRI